MNKIIIEDTRNVVGKHKNINRWLEKNNYEVLRNKLMVGDYSSPEMMNKISIDTKSGNLELIMDLTKDHQRFKREMLLANKLNIKLYILIEENADWNIDNIHLWKSPTYKTNSWKTVNEKKVLNHYKGQPISKANMETIQKTIKTIKEKYNVEFLWCNKNETGEKIIEILKEKE